ncbi:hypothetical protein [Stieleria varia]|uniref:Uncharacterized protein n=1 Tax=Stieleria varia TaxID=2528005 RepID=A0A5C6B691_9BACT|nr:hypothetical protein [Stieleria varia]TWU07468.1 hypothetical protein Pla52n_00410 [Stieleria varia]
MKRRHFALLALTLFAPLTAASVSHACDGAAPAGKYQAAAPSYQPNYQPNYRPRYEAQHAPRWQAPQPARQAPPTIDAGVGYQLGGGGFGFESGRVTIDVSGLELDCNVVNWSNDSIAFEVPSMKLRRETHATLDIVRADGSIYKSIPVQLRGIAIEPEPIAIQPTTFETTSVDTGALATDSFFAETAPPAPLAE